MGGTNLPIYMFDKQRASRRVNKLSRALSRKGEVVEGKDGWLSSDGVKRKRAKEWRRKKRKSLGRPGGTRGSWTRNSLKVNKGATSWNGDESFAEWEKSLCQYSAATKDSRLAIRLSFIDKPTVIVFSLFLARIRPKTLPRERVEFYSDLFEIGIF